MLPITESISTLVTEKPFNELSDAEQRAQLDALLKQAQAEFGKKQLSLPAILGDYVSVTGKPGIYARRMCLEIELRAIELFEQLSDGSVSGTAKIGAAIAQSVLYRVDLPEDEIAAREQVVKYVRKQINEEDIFVPLTAKEVGRLFRNAEEMSELVLKPLGMEFVTGEASEDPNAPAPASDPTG